jgi:ribosomal protein L32
MIELIQFNNFGGYVKEKDLKKELKQAGNPCPVCGSYYRRGTICNLCFTDLKESPEKEELKKKREFFQHGRFYSKTKKHRRD